MEDVKELLEDAALEIYVEVFENLGYDSLDHLLKMDPSALLDLKRLAKMREGHFVRLQTTINNWSVRLTPSTASAPTTPRSVGPAEMGPLHMGPAAAAMGPSRAMNLGPTTDLGPTDLPNGLGPNSINGPNGRNGPKSSRKGIVEDVQNLERGPHCFFELFDPSRCIGDAIYKMWRQSQNPGMSFGTVQDVPG